MNRDLNASTPADGWHAIYQTQTWRESRVVQSQTSLTLLLPRASRFALQLPEAAVRGNLQPVAHAIRLDPRELDTPDRFMSATLIFPWPSAWSTSSLLRDVSRNAADEGPGWLDSLRSHQNWQPVLLEGLAALFDARARVDCSLQSPYQHAGLEELRVPMVVARCTGEAWVNAVLARLNLPTLTNVAP